MVLGHGSNIELSSTNITLGGAVAGCTAILYKYLKPFVINWRRGTQRKKTYWSFLLLVDSSLCGMVALCSGANIVEPYGAACIGFIAAFVFLGVEHVIQHTFGLDDPLGSIAVHLGGGLTGVILLPFFMRKRHGAEDGILYWAGCEEDVFVGNSSEIWNDGDCLYTPFYQLGWHLFGILVISIWTISFSCVIFAPLWYMDILRYHPDTEVRGIDIATHGEPAYPLAATGHGWDTEGQFDVNLMGASTGNIRNVKALMNPHRKSAWNTSSLVR